MKNWRIWFYTVVTSWMTGFMEDLYVHLDRGSTDKMGKSCQKSNHQPLLFIIRWSNRPSNMRRIQVLIHKCIRLMQAKIVGARGWSFWTFITPKSHGELQSGFFLNAFWLWCLAETLQPGTTPLHLWMALLF